MKNVLVDTTYQLDQSTRFAIYNILETVQRLPAKTDFEKFFQGLLNNCSIEKRQKTGKKE